MKILLDTSVMIDALRRRQGRPELLRNLLQQGHDLACSAINAAELFSGMRPAEAQATAELIENLEYFDISREAARRAGQLKLDWQRRGRTLSLPDTIIAAVALTHDLTLATDNVKDFPMPGLKLLPLPRAS